MSKTGLMFVLLLMATYFSGMAMAEEHPAHAKNPSANYVLPPNSPVQFASSDEYGTSLHFKGSFVLTGTYRYGYLPQEEGGDLDLTFLPSPKIAASLPHWQGREQAKEIRFSNPEKFVNAVIPTSDLKKLKNKTNRSLSGKASVLVDNFEASVDCDTPSYSVNFLSVQANSDLIARRALLSSEEGC